MKVLKSGIELKPNELDKIKAGGCACGCGTGVNSTWVYDSMKGSGTCGCICSGSTDNGTGDAAIGYIY